MNALEILKDRQKSIYESYTSLQIEQNDLLDEIMEIRVELKRLQIETNDIQKAIEKLKEMPNESNQVSR